jgi:hypothetical protein
MLRFVSRGCALVFATAITHAISQAPPVSQPAYEQDLPLEHPAIRYSAQAPSDVVAALAARLQRGELTLDVDPVAGVLPSLLGHLDVNPDSQGLVFSKTSFQHSLISPRTPRAIYFNDDAAVAVVPGAAAIELAAVDPAQGVQFYVLQGRNSARPVIARRDMCLNCHHGVATLGVPGMFVSSVFPSASGMPERAGAIVTDHRTAFEERWGGWYVTGTHGLQRHRGNAVARSPAQPTLLETEGTQNVTSLDGRFDPRTHLASSSDIVALMTFEHQTFMLNLLTRLGWEARIAEHAGGTGGTGLDGRIREVVRYMLFEDEAPLQSPVAGVSSFAKTFAARGPFDPQGRSLRQFDLKRRLFSYPMSYLIYSRTFDALPADVRARIYRQLHDALSAKRATEILEIVRDTKDGLPAYWR